MENRAKTNVIQLALTAIMAKLEVNAEKPRDKSEANFAFTEDGEGSNSGTGYVKSSLPPPLIWMETKRRDGLFLTHAAFTSVFVETCSQETKHASTGLSHFSSQIEQPVFQEGSCIQNRDWTGVTTRIGGLSNVSLRSCSA